VRFTSRYRRLGARSLVLLVATILALGVVGPTPRSSPPPSTDPVVEEGEGVDWLAVALGAGVVVIVGLDVWLVVRRRRRRREAALQ